MRCGGLREGLVHFVASDAHNMRWRPLRLLPAYEVVRERFGEERAQALFVDNPLAAFEGRELPYVPEIAMEEKTREEEKVFVLLKAVSNDSDSGQSGLPSGELRSRFGLQRQAGPGVEQAENFADDVESVVSGAPPVGGIERIVGRGADDGASVGRERVAAKGG